MVKEDEKELNRREFFKCCAKVALPIIGGVLLSKTEAIAKALETTDCNYGCSYSCRATCQATCRNACQGCSHTCTGSCNSTCAKSCAGTCKDECSHTCSSSCQNSSKSGPEKTDTPSCQKKELSK